MNSSILANVLISIINSLMMYFSTTMELVNIVSKRFVVSSWALNINDNNLLIIVTQISNELETVIISILRA